MHVPSATSRCGESLGTGPMLFEPSSCCGLTNLVEPFYHQSLERCSNILKGTWLDSHHYIVPFLIIFLTLEMGALSSFLLVDDSRVCATNTCTEVDCIFRKILTAPMLVGSGRLEKRGLQPYAS